jgi:hypothetical protein
MEKDGGRGTLSSKRNNSWTCNAFPYLHLFAFHVLFLLDGCRMVLPSFLSTARFYLANVSPHLPKNTDVKERKTGTRSSLDEKRWLRFTVLLFR